MDFFVKVVATKEEAQEGPPSLIIVEQLLECGEILIAAEGEVLFEVYSNNTLVKVTVFVNELSKKRVIHKSGFNWSVKTE
ncbi:hypothetical protein ACROYT_G002481 [Oculina patagonica]